MTITETIQLTKEQIASAFGVPAHVLTNSHRPAAPRIWSLCMTGKNYGEVGPAGSAFQHRGEKHERVLVVEVSTAASALTDQINLRLIDAVAAQSAQPPILSQSWEAIGPVPVDRDENGWWSHPAIPNFDEDVDSYLAWVKAVGLEMKYKALESDPDHPLYDAWFENGECNASSWAPEEPTGDGWFTFSIHDSEDGPIWAWARRVDRTAVPASASGERQEGVRS